MKRFSIIASKIVVVVFALVGFVLTAAYLGVNLHLTNTEGIVDRQAEAFWDNGKGAQGASVAGAISSTTDTFFTRENYCSMKRLKDEFLGTFWRILTLAFNGEKELAQKNLDVAMVGLESADCSEAFMTTIGRKDFELLANMVDTRNLFILSTSTQWAFFKSSVVKDQEVINRVEKETGIKSRTLVSMLVAEQMRLFYSDRAWFEKAIAPAKVLASMSKFSLGVLGVKQETAMQIEKYLKNPESDFYPGDAYAGMLDFKTANTSQERFARLTSARDHYYQYLYAALYCKEIIAQWQKSGVDLSNRPEILATLYNIGFVHSTPNADPQMGGAEIEVGGRRIGFGRLAFDFYYSGELLNEFPQ